MFHKEVCLYGLDIIERSWEVLDKSFEFLLYEQLGGSIKFKLDAAGVSQ